MRYKSGPFRAVMSVRQDVADGHDGALVQLSAGSVVPFEKPWFLVMASATWASDNYMESYFDVDAEQSAASGYRQFDADAGLKDVGLSLASRFPLFGNFSGLAILRFKRLLGDAADSPIVDDRGDVNQVFVGAGVFYRF